MQGKGVEPFSSAWKTDVLYRWTNLAFYNIIKFLIQFYYYFENLNHRSFKNICY